MIVRTALASALALGALTSAASAEEQGPAKEPLQLTEAQMDGVTAGQVTQLNLALVAAIAAGAPNQVGGTAASAEASIDQSNTIDTDTTAQ